MTLDQLCDQVRAANEARNPIYIRGGNSKAFYGESNQGTPLDVSSYEDILSYEPTELVITAKAGTRLSDIEAALAEKRQKLAFEPPRFSVHSTIGGVVAAGLSGPRRAASGAVKDFVLGASLIGHQATEMHFGGQVMKNVAGYDVSRLLCGSLGVLGVISQVSLKVLPLPTVELTVEAQCSQEESIKWLNSWGGQPLPIVSSAWESQVLRIRLAGASAAVEAAQKVLASSTTVRVLDSAQAAAYWQGIRDQQTSLFSHHATIRYSVPSTAPSFSPVDLMEWGGALRWQGFASNAEAFAALSNAQSLAKQRGGSAMLYRQIADQRSPVAQSKFAALDGVTLALHQRLKAEFDPNQIFNCARLHAQI